MNEIEVNIQGRDDKSGEEKARDKKIAYINGEKNNNEVNPRVNHSHSNSGNGNLYGEHSGNCIAHDDMAGNGSSVSEHSGDYISDNDMAGNGSSDDDNSGNDNLDGGQSGNGNLDGEHSRNYTFDDDKNSSDVEILLPDFIESSSDVEETITPVRKKRKTNCWNLIETFDEESLAKNFVEKEKFWGLTKTNNTESGNKKYYRCTKVKSRGLQCNAGLCMHFDSTCDSIYIYRSSNEHNCNTIETKAGTQLTEEVKHEIDTLFKLKLKPNLIHETVSANHKGNPPSKTQIKNYVSSLKTKLYGRGTINVGELRIWCSENSMIPEIDDTPFIVSHEIAEDGQSFRIFVSSKTLLKLAINCQTINADATYKMIWQGYPVLVVGTTDKDRHFHLFGLAVCMSEKTADFEFLFKSIKEGVFAAYGELVNFEALISDAAHGIQNAFKNIFGNEKTIITCWFHMRKNVEKNAKNMMDKGKVLRLLCDIDQIQLMDTEKLFLKAINLFFEKWQKEKRFCEYFKMEWINKNKNWYEGARLLTPSTNNALESTNRVLKAENTLRERLPLCRFKILIMEIILKYSLKYSIIQNHFKTETTIDMGLWTSSFNWAKSNLKIESVKGDGKIIYKTISNKKKVDYTSEEPLREFLQENGSITRTVLSAQPDDWKTGQCNCKEYLKKYICHHIVGLAIRLKYVKPPVAARNTPFGEKRKRGRPAKALKALLIQ